MPKAATQLTTVSKSSLVAKFADKYSIESDKLMDILKATAFKQRDGAQVSNEQMAALLVVADQYGLNPFTKEIFAFPDKQNGIVPVVGVDGWSRIINENPQLDGIEFNYSEDLVEHKNHECHDWIECVIHRKDRTRPTVIREYFDEVVRELNFKTPWDTHPNRMHRHKALIQCARIAFGFGGIYDEDEAERIIERDITPAAQEKQIATLPAYADADFKKNFPTWKNLIATGKKTADEVIATVSSRAVLSQQQTAEITAVKKNESDAPAVTFAVVEERLQKAETEELLDLAADFIKAVADEKQRDELSAIYNTLKAKFKQ